MLIDEDLQIAPRTTEPYLKIIPVIDVRGGTVIHAKEGKRERYEPLRSRLCPTNKPLDVMLCLYRLGFKEIYLADLDGLSSGRPNLALISNICRSVGADLMLDAGASSCEDIARLVDCGCRKVVIGTETLSSLDVLEQAINKFGAEKIVCSIDLMKRLLIARSPDIQRMGPLNLLHAIEDIGIREVIALSLDRVGTRLGPDIPLIEAMALRSGASIYAGGGIRDMGDLLSLARAGAKGALIATALHTGAIMPEQLQSFLS